MSNQKIKIASDIYAKFIKYKMIDRNESMLRAYFEDPIVYDLVHQLARSFGTILLEGHEKIHLVSDGKESVFATSFTHMKEKYSDIENKKEFYLLCNILMIFLSEIDGDLTMRSRAELTGITLEKLEDMITSVFLYWKDQLNKDEDYEKKWAMNIREQMEFWLSKDLKETDNTKIKPSMRNKFGIMKKALNLLEGENLLTIIQEGDTHTIYVYPELYDRIEGLFHNYERYIMLRDSIVEAKNRKMGELHHGDN